jgi:hypothetical protein
MAGKIYGSHSGGYEEFYLLGYNAMSPTESKPPSTGLKNKPSKNPV